MVIDGSVVGIGLLKEPLEVEVKNGVLQSIRGKEAEKLDILLKSRNNATLCELGIGTNYAAGLVGIILEDEKAYQTVHIALEPMWDLVATIRQTAISMALLKIPHYIWMTSW